MSEDKKEIFAGYWRVLGDGTTITPEYEFAANVHYIDKAGRRRSRGYLFDWAFVDDRIAVEVDGGQHAPGGGRHAKDTDRAKMNTAAELGWFVFHYSPDMLKRDPASCVEQVIRALRNQR